MVLQRRIIAAQSGPLKSIDEMDVESARRQTFAQKFLAGAELFDYSCRISEAGIRMQHPEFDDEQVRAELRRRLEIGEQLEGGR